MVSVQRWIIFGQHGQAFQLDAMEPFFFFFWVYSSHRDDFSFQVFHILNEPLFLQE